MAMDIADANHKQAMLLHYVDEGADDIFQTLVLPVDTEGEQAPSVCDKTVAVLKTHFDSQKNIDHHVYLFGKEVLSLKESITQFHTRLQMLIT